MFTTASAPVSARAPPEPVPLDCRNILPPPTPPPSTLIDLTTELDDSDELPECFDGLDDRYELPECFNVVRISAREIKMGLSMPSCVHVAQLLNKRRVSVIPGSFVPQYAPKSNGTTWLAVGLQTLRTLDKSHQKLCFIMLDGHITIGYPPTVDWECDKESILIIISAWIHRCKEIFRSEHENPSKLVGWLEFQHMTHDRFVSLNIHRSDPLHTCLADLSAQIWTQHRWFEEKCSFHISLYDNDDTLCEYHMV